MAREIGDQDRRSPPGELFGSGSEPAQVVLAVLGGGPTVAGLDAGRWALARVDSVAALVAALRAAPAEAAVVSAAPGAGSAAVAQLRREPAAAGVPALVLSPRDDSDDRLRAYEAGANDYIAAPVTGRELIARVEARVGVDRQRRDADAARSFLERVLSGIDDALVVLDRNWRYRFANERVAELTGVACEDLIGREIWALFPELADSEFGRAAMAAMAERETRLCRFDYPPLGRTFDTRIYPSAEGLTIFATDVTEAARTRAALEASEARFRALAGSIEEVFWIFDTRGYRYEYVSPAVEPVYGVTPEQLYADPDLPRSLLTDAGDRSTFADPRTSGHARRVLCFRIRRPDGTLRWIESQSYPLDDADGPPARICGLARDVTARVEHERRLAADRDDATERARELERHFRLLIESTREYAIYMLDTSGRIITWNEGAHRLTGYTESEVHDTHFSILYPRAEREQGRPEAVLAEARASGSVEHEGWRVRRDGSCFWASATLTAVRDEAGRLQGFGKVVRDLTERRRAEREREQLLESLRTRGGALEAANRSLRAYGERLRDLSGRVQAAQESERHAVARELHDDIAQRITALRLLIDQLDDAGPGDTLAQARAQVGDLLTAVRDLMADLRPSELDDLGLLPALRHLARRQAAAWGIPVDVAVDSDPGRLAAELETACYRIAQEALANALRHSGCARAGIAVSRTRDALVVEVCDDGHGFDSGTVTTAKGFGLLGMRERAQFRGGDLDIDSTPGRGTRVTARLPLAAPDACAGTG